MILSVTSESFGPASSRAKTLNAELILIKAQELNLESRGKSESTREKTWRNHVGVEGLTGRTRTEDGKES